MIVRVRVHDFGLHLPPRSQRSFYVSLVPVSEVDRRREAAALLAKVGTKRDLLARYLRICRIIIYLLSTIFALLKLRILGSWSQDFGLGSSGSQDKSNWWPVHYSPD